MNGSRSIIGLDPVRDVVCELLDIVEKIIIDGNTPTSKQFLSYSPSTDTTIYQDIDLASDLDINSLTSLTLPNLTNDELMIYDSATQTNKKIPHNDLVTDTDTTYRGGTNINIDIATTPDTINLDKDIRVDNINVEVEIDLQGNDIIGGGTIYSQELNVGGNATIGGQLRVYNAGGGGTITDNFSAATGSSTGIISNLNTTFFTNGITGSQAPVQIGGGAFFTPAGSGTGQTGFDSSLAPESTPNYFLFTGSNTRQLTTMNINSYLSQGGTVSCYYIQGNSSNGGENADNGEDLVLDILGVNYNILNTTTISLGSAAYPNNIFSLFTHVLTSTEVASGYYIRFRQTSSSQSAFDTYGMKWLNFEYGIVGGTDIRFENLPTTAPSENGRVWNNNGILYIV